jgi:hypothetical protein
VTAPNVVALPMSVADRLESLARKPLAAHRNELRMLAERLRALEALDREHENQLPLDAGRAA